MIQSFPTTELPPAPRVITLKATAETTEFVLWMVSKGAKLYGPETKPEDLPAVFRLPRRRERQPRKPGIATLVKRAEKAGKHVTSITTADGTTLTFGETKPTDASNPWLADIGEVTKQ
jgi:hypothetical protein